LHVNVQIGKNRKPPFLPPKWRFGKISENEGVQKRKSLGSINLKTTSS
jgi:hypothetical protein